MSEKSFREYPADYALQNDFLVLKQIFSLAEINYKDISQDEHLAAALQRWPLLSELAALNKDA